jgi:Holliday junction resolvasome RuvABC DNA-binding subunit
MGERAMAEARRRAERERDVAAALKNLGFSAGVSRKASAEAVREEGPDAELASTIWRALRGTGRYVSRAGEGGPVWLYERRGGLVATG